MGWDLVLDIDCPQWEFAKIVTWLFVQSLRDHGITAITTKFSGNKGFHIGVPFEAFPDSVHGQETKNMFPEGPRKIAMYLLDYIGRKYVTVSDNKVTFGKDFVYTLKELQDKTDKTESELMKTFCSTCGKKSAGESSRKIQFICAQCGTTLDGEEKDQYKQCPKCNIIMEKSVTEHTKKCCANPNIVTEFNPLSIVEVDTVLIAPRHLYRAPYSYHEKSGKVSVPIDPDTLMDFEKEQAEPANVVVGQRVFLDREGVARGQATKLLVEAFDFSARKEQRMKELEYIDKIDRSERKQGYEDVQSAIPEQFFPPCIQAISLGMKDGKKRAVFMLNNFLTSVGWEYDDIEEWFKKWNQKNPEPLRDQYFLGQIRYAKQHKKKVLPPNCDNVGYYKAFGVCNPDPFCKYVKNPANYAIKKARYAQNNNKNANKTTNKNTKNGGKKITKESTKDKKNGKNGKKAAPAPVGGSDSTSEATTNQQ